MIVTAAAAAKPSLQPLRARGVPIAAICLSALLLLALPFEALARAEAAPATEGSAAASADGSPAPPDEARARLPYPWQDAPPAGASYWGLIPPPADSLLLREKPRPLPAWEWPGRAVYGVVGYPFHLLKQGLRRTVIFADESGIIEDVLWLIGPHGRYDLVFTVSAGGLDGFTLGVAGENNDLWSTGSQLNLKWAWSTEHESKGSVGLATPGERLTLGARYSSRPEARFFGIGPGATEAGESFFTQELGWGGIGLRQRLFERVDLEGIALYSEVGTRDPAEAEYLPVDERHGAVVGFGERSKGSTLSLGLLRDSTGETGRPERGGVFQLEASRFLAAGDVGTDFWTFRAEAQRFLALPNSKQVLVARAYGSWIDAADLAAIPFQRLLVNDEPDQFRGYPDHRWRDRGIVGLTVEYRWPFWAYRTPGGMGVDMVLFSDLGQVFGEQAEIGGGNLTESYGLGLRLVGEDGYAGRLEFAWSDEGMVIRLKSDQLFQFSKGGLQHGRDQVALR